MAAEISSAAAGSNSVVAAAAAALARPIADPMPLTLADPAASDSGTAITCDDTIGSAQRSG